MASGFVPASDSSAAPSTDKPSIPVNDEWEAAKASIEQRRREREQGSQQDNAKSLYETLQANKGTSCSSASFFPSPRSELRDISNYSLDHG
jgi:hypothetical protein